MTSGQRPKYQRIADDLRAAIAAGTYGPGERIPGENDLMATYGVARMTARQALAVLADDGLTDTRRGAGVFVRPAADTVTIPARDFEQLLAVAALYLDGLADAEDARRAEVAAIVARYGRRH
jgi:DNA-binding GntR family transcriptional regulator